MAMTLLDEFLPVFQFHERHSITIRASPAEVFTALRTITMTELPLFRVLWRLRAMGNAGPHADEPVLRWAVRAGFVELASVADREIVSGRIGKFWNIFGDSAPQLENRDFFAYDVGTNACAMMNFSIREASNGGHIVLTTETRINVPERISRIKFRAYWLIIRPWSGLIRREMLRKVKRTAEDTTAEHRAVPNR